jgi:hypothetical protein
MPEAGLVLGFEHRGGEIFVDGKEPLPLEVALGNGLEDFRQPRMLKKLVSFKVIPHNRTVFEFLERTKIVLANNRSCCSTLRGRLGAPVVMRQYPGGSAGRF